MRRRKYRIFATKSVAQVAFTITGSEGIPYCNLIRPAMQYFRDVNSGKWVEWLNA